MPDFFMDEMHKSSHSSPNEIDHIRKLSAEMNLPMVTNKDECLRCINGCRRLESALSINNEVTVTLVPDNKSITVTRDSNGKLVIK
ncbi:MAG: hypothetical protein QM500_15620 [Methylococcales bacterium]